MLIANNRRARLVGSRCPWETRVGKALMVLTMLFGMVVAEGADRNGYTAAYEDRQALPSCNGGRDGNGVKIISNNDDWKQINSSQYNVFCVRHGDYRSAGKIILRASGSSERRRYILPYPATQWSHPVKLSVGQQVLVKQLEFRGADYWYLDGLTLTGFTYGNNFYDQANHNTISRSVFEGDSMVPGNGIINIKGVSTHNTIQKSVIRNCQMRRDTDSPAVRVMGGSDHAMIVSNEIYNCTDGIVTVGESSRIRGTIIENNGIYITSARYSRGRGVRDTSGPFACAENGIDIKAASTSTREEDATLIIKNRIWNFKPGDDWCDGSGDPKGSAVNIHFSGDRVQLLDNIIFENGNGISFPNRGADDVRVEGNVIHTTRIPADLESSWSLTGTAIAAHKSLRSIFYRNTIVDADKFMVAGGGNEFKCNAIIDGGEQESNWGSSGTASNYNGYYGTVPFSEPVSYVSGSEWGSGYGTLCFYHKLLTGPVQKCLSRAKPSSGSPHARLCDTSKLR